MGSLLHMHRGSKAEIDSFLDDYEKYVVQPSIDGTDFDRQSELYHHWESNIWFSLTMSEEYRREFRTLCLDKRWQAWHWVLTSEPFPKGEGPGGLLLKGGELRFWNENRGKESAYGIWRVHNPSDVACFSNYLKDFDLAERIANLSRESCAAFGRAKYRGREKGSDFDFEAAARAWTSHLDHDLPAMRKLFAIAVQRQEHVLIQVDD